MFLKQIKLTNIRSIKELDLSFTEADGDIRKWTLLLGENGCGKTSVLRSIAVVVAGSRALPELLPRPETWIRLGATECAIEATLETARGQERAIALRWSRGQHIRDIFDRNHEAMDQIDSALEHSTRNYFLIGYGATRRLAGGRSVSPSREPYEHPRARSVSTLFSNDAVLNPLDTWAMDLDYRLKSGFASVRNALEDLLPGVSLARIDRRNRELIFATQDGDLPLDQLSEGYQNMAAWCGDLLYRITEVYKDYKSPLSARGVLLIDEIDLHLHPVWQRVLRDFLNRKLPHFQILATTHSPLTAQQSGEGELFILRRKEHDGGEATLEPYPGAPNELLLHQLILSPAFGLTTLDSKKVEDMKGEYRSLEARKATLPASGKRRLRELHDELIDFPEWSRPTEEDRKQVELLEEIHRVLKDRASGPPKGPGRKRRA